MVRRTAALVFTVSLSLCCCTAEAADPDNTRLAAPSASEATRTDQVLVAGAATPLVMIGTPRTRPLALPVLYVSFAALQIFDGYSTSRALSQGGHEINPLMDSIAGNSAALWTVKAATTAASILLAEKMWRTHPVRAIVVLAVTNGFYAALALNNARTLRQQ